MADRVVRASFEARVENARKGMAALAGDTKAAGKSVDALTKDLKTLDAQKVAPDVDVQIGDAKKRLTDLTLQLGDLKKIDASPEVTAKIEAAKADIKTVRAELKDLNNSKTEVKITASLGDAQKRMREITADLGELRTMEATPEVTVKIAEAQKRLRSVKAEVRELNSAKAQITVKADTSGVEAAISDLGGSGDAAGDDIGQGMVSGILSALGSIPIAGAVVGVGAAIAGGIFLGIKQGLAIDAERDLFSARSGLDEATSAKFGRAAGGAYANAWGDSVAANLDTAKIALDQGLIDSDAIEADVEKVITSLTGVSNLMGEDIPKAARAAGQMIKTGMVKDAQGAFDVLTAGYQAGASASDDMLDTLIEYPTHFRDLGLSAQDSLGLMMQSLNAGVFNMDKVADALKEVTIRVKDLSPAGKAAGEALQTLGLDHEKMAKAFAEGGPAARKGFDQILDGLAAVKDPAERSGMAVALFGTQAEDMAAALNTLDLDTAVKMIEGVGGSAGAADRALATMSDNTSSKMVSAQRNIEMAMDGIKGALAEAFSDDIGGAADWVSKNRAPLMQFFLDAMNGAFEAGKGFLNFGATALEAVADILDSMGSLSDAFTAVRALIDPLGAAMDNTGTSAADSMRAAAEKMRGDYTDSLDAMQDKANAWAAPEIMKARVHDATVVMTGEMDSFSAAVDASGGTVTINGDKLKAQEALDLIVANINDEDGTVTINGDRVPADRALSTVMAAINSGSGSVSIGANTGGADGKLSAVLGKVARSVASFSVGADAGAADRAISHAARDRTATIHVTERISRVMRNPGGIHDGGYVTGLHAGGRVPGRDPGYDNVLWPLNSGGRTLQQPLAGGEYVVNSKSTALYGPLLEWINGGGGNAPAAPSGGNVYQVTIDAAGLGSVRTIEDFLAMIDTQSRMRSGR